MGVGQFVRKWVPALILGVAAFAIWQAAERRDTDTVSVEEIPYERALETPLLSARRVPRTIQTPVVDAALVPLLRAMINDSPADNCLLVQVGDRVLEPVSRPMDGLVPASNQKLVTTYAALEVLGPDFRFKTRVTADALPVDGVVNGNLYLVGSGDPFLSTEEWWTQYETNDARFHTRLEDLADRIVASGVVEVTGTVVGDESLFDDRRQGEWAERLINGKQSGPLSALTVNEGFVDWPALFVSARQRRETNDPPVHSASVLIQLLGERGVTVAGAPSAGVAPAQAEPLTEIDSPPLLDVLTHINAHSSNLGAELLLKRLGVEGAGVGTTEAGAAVVLETLEAEGIPTERLRIDDGSGLAETDRLTCQALAGILTAAGADSPFAATLAVAGERGTLITRMVDSAATGQVFAKTGSLNTVSALSGFVRSVTDPEIFLTFAYIVNAQPFVDQQTIELQDAFAASLTGYPGSPTIDDLSPLEPTIR